MSNYKNKLQNFYRATEKAGRAIWKILSLSLADKRLSFAKVVCISIEADGIYLVCAEKMLWRTTVRHYRYYPLEENKTVSPEYLATVVSGFVTETKLFRASFVLCLPRAWTIVKRVELPLAAKENLSRVVSFELDRFTPLSKNSAFYNYSVLGEDSQNIKILLAVTRADRVQGYLDVLQYRNIKIKKIIISSFAIKSLIQNTYPKENAVFISLRDDAYEYGSIDNSFLLHSASGSVESGEETGIDGIIKQALILSEELARHGRRPQIVIDADDRQFNALRDKFGTMKVSNLDRDIKYNVPRQKKELSAVALGGALDALYRNPHSINLLNQDNNVQGRTPLALTFVFLAGIAAMAAFYFLMPLSYEQQKLDEMDRHIKSLKPAVKKVEELKDEVTAIKGDIQAIGDFKKQNDLAMNIIKDMTAILPPKTWLTRLRITDKTVEIEGYSTSATEIIFKLENSKYFKKVEFASPTFRDPRQNSDRFIIRMELKNENNNKETKAGVKNDREK
ncbi:MAG: PilN domain-containing protein [Smithella sp.]